MIISIEFIIIIILLLLLLLLLQTSKLYYRTLLMKKANYIKTDNLLVINLYYYTGKQNHPLNNSRYSTPNIQRLSYASIKVT